MENEGKGALRDAPASLRKFFKEAETPPEWLNYAAFAPGVRMFHRHSQVILAAFVAGVLIEGFTTNIAKSFLHHRAGASTRASGVWGKITVIMTEIFLGLAALYRHRRRMETFGPYQDTCTHRLRHLLGQIRKSGSTEAWGVPISAAHLGYAISACFSKVAETHENLGC